MGSEEQVRQVPTAGNGKYPLRVQQGPIGIDAAGFRELSRAVRIRQFRDVQLYGECVQHFRGLYTEQELSSRGEIPFDTRRS